MDKKSSKNQELENQLSYKISQNQEITNKLSSFETENEKIRNILDDYKQENDCLKNNQEIENERLISMHNLLQEMKITLHSSFSIAKVFIHKFTSVINEDLIHNYSKSFCEILTKLSKLNNFLPSETNPLEIVKNLEDFSRYMGTELEVRRFYLLAYL